MFDMPNINQSASSTDLDALVVVGPKGACETESSIGSDPSTTEAAGRSPSCESFAFLEDSGVGVWFGAAAPREVSSTAKSISLSLLRGGSDTGFEGSPDSTRFEGSPNFIGLEGSQDSTGTESSTTNSFVGRGDMVVQTTASEGVVGGFKVGSPRMVGASLICVAGTWESGMGSTGATIVSWC